MLSDRCPVCLPCLSVTLVYCGQTAGWIKMPLGTEVGLGSGHVVLDGDPASPPPEKRGHSSPQFSTNVFCGQTVGSIKMPLGREVDLGPDDIVLHGYPERPKGHSSPLFSPRIVAKGLDGSRCHLVLRHSRFNSSRGPGKARPPT